MKTLRKEISTMLVCFALGIVVSLPCANAGTSFYVSPSGDDANSGDADHPFKTIQRAVNGSTNSAKAGDTVNLRGGVYRPNPANYGYTVVELTTSGTLQDPITFQAYPGEKPILKGSVLVDSNAWIQVSTDEIADMGFPTGANIWKVVNWFCTTNAGVVKLTLNNQRSWQSNPQQVFASDSETNDGVALTQIAWPSSEFTTPSADGVGNSWFTGSEFFDPTLTNHVQSVTNFVMELRAHTNVVQNYIWTNFTTTGRSILNGNNDTNNIWATTLAVELNAFMYRGPFDANVFSGVALSQVSQKLRDHPQLSSAGNEMVKYNRALIQDAFNYELYPGLAQTPVGSHALYWGADGFPWDMTNDYSFYYREVAYPTNASVSDTSVIYVRLPPSLNPATKVMEVSAANFIFTTGSNVKYVKVKNLTFRHSNSTTWDKQAFAISASEDGVMENCDIQWCDNGGVSVGPRGLLFKCKISNMGRMGFVLSPGARADSCLFSKCNYRLFSIGWTCGGTKSYGGTTIENCEFTSNYGPPIWYDFADDMTAPPTFVHNNYIHHNYAPVVPAWSGPANSWTNGGPTWQVRGMPMISLEASRNVYVYNNLIISNATKAFFLGIQNCQVFNNIVMYTDADWVGDGQHPWYSVSAGDNWGRTFQDNQVYYNIFYNNYGGHIYVRTNSGINPENWNIWDYNLYFNSITNQLTFQDQAAANYYASRSFGSWQQSSGYDQHSVYRDPGLTGPFDMEFALSDFGSIIAGAMRSYEDTQDTTFDGRLGSAEGNINSLSNSLLSKLSMSGGSLSGPLFLSQGSQSAPSLSFVGDTDTGLFHSAADEIGFTTGGSAKWFLNGSGTFWSSANWLWTGGGVTVGSGSISTPTLAFTYEPTMGFYRPTAGEMRFASDGVDRFRITTQAVEFLQSARIAGTITNDALSANTVVVSGANKQLSSSSVTSTELGNLSGSTANIQSQLDGKFSTAGGALTGAIQMPVGSSSSPTISFNGDTGVGFYHPQNGTIGVSGSVAAQGGVTATNSADATEVRLASTGSTPMQAYGGFYQAVMADNNSNNTAKAFRLGMLPYNLSQYPMTLMAGYVGASSADLYVGGGTGSPFQNIYFCTATNLTYGGYQALRIFPDGAVGIGNSVSASGAGNLTVQGNINSGNLTANRALMSDGSKNITASSVTSTELGYLGGVTSAVQSQLNSKLNISSVSSFALGLLDDPDVAAARSTLQLVPGTDVQAFDADLADLADGSLTGNKVGSGIDAVNITTGNLEVSRLNSGTGATDSTYWRGDGTWAASPGPTMLYVTTNQSIGTTATDVGGLTFAVEANKDYSFNYIIAVSTSGTTEGYQISLNGPASPTEVNAAIFAPSSSSLQTINYAINTYGTAVVITDGPGTSARWTIRISGSLQNGATAGTFSVRARSESAANGVTIRKASWGEYKKLN